MKLLHKEENQDFFIISFRRAPPASMLSLHVVFGTRLRHSSLASLVEAYGRLADVEEEEGFGLVCHVGLEVAPDDDVPRGAVLAVEELLDVPGLLFLGYVRVDGDGSDGLRSSSSRSGG